MENSVCSAPAENTAGMTKLSDAGPKKLRVFEKLTRHQVNPANEVLEIIVCDEAGSGGAHHDYLLYWPNKHASLETRRITFQNGPIQEQGVNGLTQEALLAIVAHRLECFQAGPYACRENGEALAHVLDALHVLKERTRARQARGVEGTHQK